MEAVPRFHWADYLVFALSLVASAAIGVFYGFIEKKNKTTADQLVGGRSMKPLPVAVSCLASFLSAPFIIGIPAEVYLLGPMYGVIVFGYIIAAPITSYGFIPTFHRLNLTSAYEYIERRFSKSVRMVASCVFVFMMLLYMGVVVYAPARAFSQVTGLPELVTILALGVICTFYTAVGGMKAVVWTDVLQMAIILLGLVALVIKGGVDAGGPARIFSIAKEGGRLDFTNIDPSPSARHTWWTQTVGGVFITLTITATNQAMIQRYLSIRTLKEAQMSVWYSLILMIVCLILVGLVGIVVYAVYYGCDPITTRDNIDKNTLIPMFMMETLGNLHGVPGLFTAAVFSATLSTVSSGINALAAVILIDFIKPLYKFQSKKEMGERISAITTKLLAAFLGFVTIGIAYLSPLLGSTLLQIVLSLFGMVGGPMLGLFTLAVFMPCVNHWGALLGLLSSLTVSFWISIGSILHPNFPPILPLRTDNCSTIYTANYSNVPLHTVTHTAIRDTEAAGVAFEDSSFQVTDLYKLSYMWYSALSVLIAVIVGLVVSLITGGHKEKVDAKLVFNYRGRCGAIYNFCGYKCCRFNEDDIDSKDISSNEKITSNEEIPVGKKMQNNASKDWGIFNDALIEGGPVSNGKSDTHL